MTRYSWPIVITLLAYCSAVGTSASAEGSWVLWVETPVGSDSWAVAQIPEPRFKAKEDCERRAQELNTVELAIAKAEGASGQAHDLFICLPDTVDPRPEGALR
jgi:ABC-type glycerol-3-phosphate transport system substrate-binding protein